MDRTETRYRKDGENRMKEWEGGRGNAGKCEVKLREVFGKLGGGGACGRGGQGGMGRWKEWETDG